MSIASSGDVFASAAGSQRAQTTGADVQRIQQETANHQRQIDFDHLADSAEGIAETDPDHATRQRDADGRRPWEIGPPKRAIVSAEATPIAPVPTHDASEHCGQSIDLTA
jgi:hypothetical protein